MSIHEWFVSFRDRREIIRQEITSEAEQLTRSIQPYADKMGYSRYNLDVIRSEDPIGDTGFCSIMLRIKEENKLLCWFLQSGYGFKTGDLQVTMPYRPASDGTNPLSFETIEVFKFPSKKEKRRWFPLKPADQLKNLKLANECLGAL